MFLLNFKQGPPKTDVSQPRLKTETIRPRQTDRPSAETRSPFEAETAEDTCPDFDKRPAAASSRTVRPINKVVAEDVMKVV
jgi:hypothetical protein